MSPHASGSRAVKLRPWFKLSLPVAILVLVAAGLGSTHLRTLWIARSARLAIAAGDLPRALALLERWRSLDDSNYEIPLLQARLRYQLGDYAAVSPLIDRATWLGCPEPIAFRLRALLLVKLRKFIEAEPILINLLNEAAGPEPELEEALARVYLETYRLNHAVKIIELWIKHAPTDPKPYLWWTEIDRRLDVENPGARERHYRQALALDPRLAEARLGLAETLRASHQPAAAIAEYRRYLELKPNDLLGIVGIARTALEDGDLETARAAVADAQRIDPNHPETHKLMAALAILDGQYAPALEHLEIAVRADPLDVDSGYKQELVLSRLGRKQEAERVRERVNRLRADQLAVVKIRDRLIADPTNNDIRCEMARWMFEHGLADEAMRWLESILASSPGHREAARLLIEYHRKRGEIGLANFYRERFQSSSRPEH